MISEWNRKRVEDIASRVAMGPFGSDIRTDNFVSHGIPIIRGNNLKGRFEASGFVFLTPEKADELKNSNAFPGDLVFTHRGTLGQVGVIPEKPYDRYVVSQSQMLLSLDRSKADSLFFYYYFQAPEGQHQLGLDQKVIGIGH